MRGWLRASGLVAVSGALLLLSGGRGLAGAPVSVPAIDAYVETFPTSSGDAAVGVVQPRTLPLPAAVRAQLHRVRPSQARALVQVATSSQYGAPTSTLAAPQEAPTATSARASAPRPKGRAAVRGAATAPRKPPAARDLDLEGVFTGPDSGVVAGFAAVLAAATVGAFAWALAGRARRGS